MKTKLALTLLLCSFNVLPCYSNIINTTKTAIEELVIEDSEVDDFDDFLADLGNDDLTAQDMEGIDLATIDRFSEDPTFLDKMSFAIQYLQIQCNNSWKTAKTHVLQNKELYVIGTTTTAAVIAIVIIIALLKKKNQTT